MGNENVKLFVLVLCLCFVCVNMECFRIWILKCILFENVYMNVH